MPEIIRHMIRHVTESDIDLEKIAIVIVTGIVIEENVAIVTDQKKLRDQKGYFIEIILEGSKSVVQDGPGIPEYSLNLLVFNDIVK